VEFWLLEQAALELFKPFLSEVKLELRPGVVLSIWLEHRSPTGEDANSEAIHSAEFGHALRAFKQFFSFLFFLFLLHLLLCPSSSSFFSSSFFLPLSLSLSLSPSQALLSHLSSVLGLC
jgi:hypothetical protein